MQIQKHNHFIIVWVGLGVTILIAGTMLMKVGFDSGNKSHSPTVVLPTSISSLSALLALPVEELAHVDIARMNLLCAKGLPGAADLDVNTSLATLEQMAARVRAETKRNFHKFQSNPAEFENSEAFFRMIMLAVVLTDG